MQGCRKLKFRHLLASICEYFLTSQSWHVLKYCYTFNGLEQEFRRCFADRLSQSLISSVAQAVYEEKLLKINNNTLPSNQQIFGRRSFYMFWAWKYSDWLIKQYYYWNRLGMIWRILQFLEVLPPKAKHLLDLRNSAYQPRPDHHVQ